MAIRVKPRHKFNAQPTVVDNIRFASKKEAQRYGELKLLEKAGAIAGLKLQPEFHIKVAARRSFTLHGQTISYEVAKRVAVYRADFQYIEGGQTVIEDVKGVSTPVYKLKKKLVEAQYGITVREV